MSQQPTGMSCGPGYTPDYRPDYRPDCGGDYQLRQRLSNLFDGYDSDKNGTLSCKEIDDMLSDIGRRMPPGSGYYYKTKTEMMAELDRNRDGVISREEFIDGFIKYFRDYQDDLQPIIIIVLGERSRFPRGPYYCAM